MATMTPPKPQIFNVPNQLTALRLLLSFVLFGLIAYEQWIWCIIVFAVAAFTDWLDGYLARLQNLQSALGRVFDPLVDKVMVCGSYIFLLGLSFERSGLAPWMVTLVVARELLINGLRSFIESRGVSFGADWLGKIKMVLQCASLFAVFVVLHAENPERQLSLIRDLIIYAMLAATAFSGLQYIWKAVWILR